VLIRSLRVIYKLNLKNLVGNKKHFLMKMETLLRVVARRELFENMKNTVKNSRTLGCWHPSVCTDRT